MAILSYDVLDSRERVRVEGEADELYGRFERLYANGGVFQSAPVD